MSPWPVRLVRAVIAVLVWTAFCIPLASVFRWMGRELVMPPSYGPAWKGFVWVVGGVLFLAFMLERPPLEPDEESTEQDWRSG